MRIRSFLPLIAITVLGLLDLARYYPLLPEKVASHFDGAGLPNGWMPKDGFAVVTLILFGFAGLVQSLAAASLRGLPDEKINLPNKAYWLAPERRQETLGFISDHQMRFAAITQMLLVLVLHLVYTANLLPQPQLSSSIWILLGGFLAVTAVWLVLLFRRFQLR